MSRPTTPFVNLFMTEVRRALHRRVVWVLVGLAIALAATAGVIAFADSAGGLTAGQRDGRELHPAVMTTWWMAGTGDGYLVVGSVFLLLGAFIGGASVAGAE